MKNLNNFPFARKLDGITGEYIDEILPYDVQIASGESSPSSAGTFTLASFTVAPGQECVIGEVDLGAAAATLAEVTLTYKDYSGDAVTITRYLYLGAAGYISSDTDFKDRPFLVFYNPIIQNNPVTVSMQILNAAASTQYVGNMAYVVRATE